ncbi:hypothetical protein [Actinomadura soli]|uniref:hypothetical protein n=1 Tax=Actinomadura soli TaxID=2508997 RepID=UPI00197A72A8|nr:hypothetical protein [Actinomadura soli]
MTLVSSRTAAVDAVVVSIEIDMARLGSYADAHLAMLWQVAQANPAPYDDRQAGELVERIGREIVRRWLSGVTPELWKHQGRSYYWSQLTKFAIYRPGGTGSVGDPDWHDGTWVARPAPDDGVAESGDTAAVGKVPT